MKAIFSIIITFLLFMFSFCFVGCNSVDNDSILRIHIRANSNSVRDQEIKLTIRDELIKYITDSIEGLDSCNDVKRVLSSEILNIESIADAVLERDGYGYVSRASIRREYFPTRSYDGLSFPAGYYDALIVELGDGVGDNWWCVAYPPLCFVGEDVGDYSVRYRSKIIDFIKNISR